VKSVRVEAGQLLARFGDLRGVPGLIDGMEDNNVRTVAAVAAELYPLTSGDDLTATWVGNAEAAQIAQRQLVEAAPRIAPRLIAVVRDGSLATEIRHPAACVLPRIGPSAIPHLIEAFEHKEDEDDDIKEALSISLSAIRGSIPATISALCSSYSYVRFQSARALVQAHAWWEDDFSSEVPQYLIS